MSESKHTPEPWSVHPTLAQIISNDPDSPICGMLWPTEDRSKDETFANARRIVSAVNACANISTEALEAGVVAEMVEQLRRLSTLSDEILMTLSAKEAESLSAVWEKLDAILAKIGGAS